MLPPWPFTATSVSKPWCTSESQTSRKTCKSVVVDSRIEPGNCMWYQDSVTFSVGATSRLTPCSSPSAAARVASDRAMTQSVSSGMWWPCCSVVPIGIRTASTPASIRAWTSGHVMRSIRCSANARAIFTQCQTSCNRRCDTRPSMGATIEVNGVNLWHEITGEGEPVVQIHGAGFGHFNFAPATPELSKHFRVIDYDMRGYGQSDRPVQHYDMEVWADDLARLMDALGLGSAH